MLYARVSSQKSWPESLKTDFHRYSTEDSGMDIIRERDWESGAMFTETRRQRKRVTLGK